MFEKRTLILIYCFSTITTTTRTRTQVYSDSKNNIEEKKPFLTRTMMIIIKLNEINLYYSGIA